MAGKKVLITGVCGLLGQNLASALAKSWEVYGIDLLPAPPVLLKLLKGFENVDISSPGAVRAYFERHPADIVINTAAITNVDACEKEKEKAESINLKAVEYLLEGCGNARFVQISTDYVLDGKAGPYADNALPCPVSFYGLTKLKAEQAVMKNRESHLIVRTMVLFGTGFNVRPDFITWVRTSLSEGKEITVVTDQTGNITLASNLARNIGALLNENISGIVSLAGSDLLSRFEIARKTARFYGFDEGLIKPVKTADLKQAAPRPLNSGFIHDRARSVPGVHLLTFKEQLKVYDDEQKSINRTPHV